MSRFPIFKVKGLKCMASMSQAVMQAVKTEPFTVTCSLSGRLAHWADVQAWCALRRSQPPPRAWA